MDESESAARAGIEARDKHLAHLRARCALAGYGLYIVNAPDGKGSAFMASRWGRTVDLPDVDSVEAFLRQIGAK